MFDECGLHDVHQGVARLQAFDGLDLAAFDLGGQCEATEHPLAIDVDRAGAALALVAALLGSGQEGVFAQGIEQGGARVQAQVVAA